MNRPGAALLLLFLTLVVGAKAEAPYIILASTTSTRDSGLLAHILPRFEARTGIAVRVIAVGTGRALGLGEKGDVDALLVHDTVSEERFMAEGHGSLRREVMYNDFVIVGPVDDPAGIATTTDAAEALATIAARKALFVSRGDDSGTHKAELRLWKAADHDPSGASGSWYRETGSGMGATLNTASELGAYALSDRGTWLSFRNRRELRILVQGDPPLRNVYGVLVVNPQRHPHTKARLARKLVDWLSSEEGRRAIADFRLEDQPLFFPLGPTVAKEG